MEAFGKVHPSHRSYHQWAQMTEKERQFHRKDIADLFIQTARRYEHSAIFLHPNPGTEDEQIRLVDLVRERTGDEFFLLLYCDPTYGIPSGTDMVSQAAWFYEHLEEAKAEAPPAEKAKEEAVKEAAVKEAAPREEPVKEAAPREAPKPEAAPKAEEKPALLDLTGLRIQFAFDDYNLSNKSKENLEKIASWMSKAPAAKVQIEGHTCDIGTSEYNLALGERRANSARKYLEGLGVSPARISTISYGEERPLVPNADEANRSKNRRDEFIQSR